jgi:hypothetical protein
VHNFHVSGTFFMIVRIKSFLPVQKVNLSGCPQITLAIMLLSLLPSSHAVEPALRNIVKQISLILESLEEGDKCLNLLCLLPMSSFEAVQEVDISKCPKLHLEAAIMCFSMSFPSLRTLKAAYLLNVKATILHQLVQNFPLLCEVDLSSDTSPLIPAQVSVVSSSPAITLSPSNQFFRVVDDPVNVTSSKRSGLSLSNITKLTLEGRSDLCGEIFICLFSFNPILSLDNESLCNSSKRWFSVS